MLRRVPYSGPYFQKFLPNDQVDNAQMKYFFIRVIISDLFLFFLNLPHQLLGLKRVSMKVINLVPWSWRKAKVLALTRGREQFSKITCQAWYMDNFVKLSRSVWDFYHTLSPKTPFILYHKNFGPPLFHRKRHTVKILSGKNREWLILWSKLKSKPSLFIKPLNDDNYICKYITTSKADIFLYHGCRNCHFDSDLVLFL